MIALEHSSKPRLAAKARLKWDAIRQQQLLLFPEGMLVLKGSAHEVLTLCDGQRTVGEIVTSLRAKYDDPARADALQNAGKDAGPPSNAIEADVRELLQRLAARGLVVLSD